MNEQQKKDFRVINGNSLDVLLTLEENSVDAIITDPPYELGFMGKKWDRTGIAYNVELWKKALRVLKPGGHLLAFGGSRTFHRIAVAIEDAGFEIRDTIMWLYGSGFPKSMNIGKSMESLLTSGSANKTEFKNLDGEKQPSGDWGISKLSKEQDFRPKDYCEDEHLRTTKVNYNTKAKEWDGWGTALKPAFEPIIMARKPIAESSIAENCLKWGVGGINIDECRVYGENVSCHNAPKGTFAGKVQTMPKFKGRNKLSFGQYDEKAERIEYVQHEGRFPANLITDGSDEVASGMSNDEMRYFYTGKASKKDRDEGLDAFENINAAEITGRKEHSKGLEMEGGKQNPYAGKASPNNKNIHPTVKPVELMQYLVRLVSPKGATILDIFNGSGSTGKAVAFENRERDANYKYIGIELTPEYVEISLSRIDYALNKYEYDAIKEDEENKKKGQLNIFDFEWVDLQ